MQFALIADTFPPLRTSGAVQLRDLTREFVRQGHDLTVMLPGPDLDCPWKLENFEGAEILRLRAPKTKDIGYLRRTLSEFIMPYAMLRNLRKSPLSAKKWDGVIWYSPSIFHGPLVSALKRASGCKAYLIIRDIFPEWAVDMGLMGRGPAYRFFDAVARYQYSVADIIGVQADGNRAYFDRWQRKSGRSLEVLQNWLGEPAQARCSIRLDDTALAGRKVFVYAGNIGIAQGLDVILELVARMAPRRELGFLFVGRGSEVQRFKEFSKARSLDNILFFDEIDPDEIPGLYAQCSAGIVSLDHRHKSHNIPGKFLTYMQCGLPVLANINRGNDLADIIRSARLGEVCESNRIGDLQNRCENLLLEIASNPLLGDRCRALFSEKYSASHAVDRISSSFFWHTCPAGAFSVQPGHRRDMLP